MNKIHFYKRHPLVLVIFAVFNVTPMAYAVSPNIVISQVYGGGGNTGATFRNDFIELFNRGNTAANLSGMSVQYASSTGITWAVTNLTNVTLQPGQYYLVQEAAGTGGTINLPTPDTIGTISMSGTTGKVALVSNVVALTGSCPTSNVVDFIGFGAANCSESLPTAALSNTTAGLRASSGCTDTDNNIGDFTITGPNPRNTTTALNPCGGSTPSINLSVSTNAANEAGATVVTVTATASSAVTGNQTVTLAVSGAGISTGDYLLSNPIITILSGQTTGSVTFTVVDDVLAEGTETAILAINTPSSGISLGATISQNITITDNEPLVGPNLTINDVSQNEGNAGNTNYNFTISLSAPAPVGGVTFNIATQDSTATGGSDYMAQSLLSQTIPAGNSSYNFIVLVTGDTATEANETFFVNVSNVSGATIVDGQGVGTIINDDISSACGSPATLISAVQGSGAATPLSGVAGTTIEGIVVGDYQGDATNSLRGFFVQEESADVDANPATSEGIFVFNGTNGSPAVSVGDKVRVTGTPTEFFNMTQLATLTSVQVCASNQALPSAAALTLPVPGVPNGDLIVATTAINAYYEKFEGMLVTFPTKLKVSEYFELERYGQLVLSQGGRIPTFTNVSNPSSTGLINHNIKLAKRQIILDDTNNIQNFYITASAVNNIPPIPLPYPTGGLSTTNRFRGGDTISNLTGVLHWSFAGLTGTDAWRIRPVEEQFDYNFVSTNPRKPTAPNVGGTLKVAGFNVLNYFTTVDVTSSSTSGPCGPDGIQDCRGADSTAELVRQTDKAVAALCGINADIVGLMEIENNATASLSDLVAATNVISGCGPYNFINTGTIGGDAIKVGLLYKPATVSPLGTYQLLDSSDDLRFIDTKNRPTLAQTFSQIGTGGQKLTVAVNHLKSKGSDCNTTNFGGVLDIDNNDGQGNCNLTRKNAALALVDWLNSDPTGSGDPDFLIIGDLNSYAKEDPIKAVENGPDDVPGTIDDYTNLIKAFGGSSAYSYVFDGQTGYLDHALASKSLLPQVTRAADWHINADEPPSFDYNDSVQTTGEASFEARPAALPLYAADQYRTSDHDPVVIGLQLTETINVIDGTIARNTLNGTAAKDRITGLGSADILTGGLGADEFVYVGTGDGIDTIIDFTLGDDKIVLTALMQSLGYQGNNPLTDGIVKFATSGNNTVVNIDPDGTGPAAQRALIVVNGVSILNLNNAANFIF